MSGCQFSISELQQRFFSKLPCYGGWCIQIISTSDLPAALTVQLNIQITTKHVITPYTSSVTSVTNLEDTPDNLQVTNLQIGLALTFVV